MKYSENEVALLYNEDFSVPFKAEIGSPAGDIDIPTFVQKKRWFLN